MNKQVGFTLVEGLLIALVAGVICVAGLYIYNNTQGSIEHDSVNNLETTHDKDTGEGNTTNTETSTDIDFEDLRFKATFPDGWTRTNYEEKGEPCGEGEFPGEWKEIELTSDDGDIITIYENGGLRGCGGGFSSDISPLFSYTDIGLQIEGDSVELNCEAGEEQAFCAGSSDEVFIVPSPKNDRIAPNGFSYFFTIKTGSRSSDEVSQALELLAIIETIEFID